MRTWKGCNAWYLLTSPSEALRGHGWIGLLAGREKSHAFPSAGRTVASLWIFFLLTVARAASDLHRSSRSSNHDKLIKCQGHHREAKPGCQVYGDFVPSCLRAFLNHSERIPGQRIPENSGTGPESGEFLGLSPNSYTLLPPIFSLDTLFAAAYYEKRVAHPKIDPVSRDRL